MRPSPCINVCKMDKASGLCTGCFRTIEEISAWANAGDDRQSDILAAISRRRKESKSKSAARHARGEG